MKKIILPLLLFSGFFINSSFAQKKEAKPEAEKMFLISTEFGNIKLKLYNETLQHRDNFIKLVKDTFFDGTLFHRVINGFMIQGGDPSSKNAAPNVMLGEGDVGYTIPAEFNPKFIHKKGALAAARQGDNVNPTKASSGCQFYIVHGKVFSSADLDAVEARINNQTKQQLFGEIISRAENSSLRNRFIVNQTAQNADSLKLLSSIVEPMIEKELATRGPFKFTEEQRKIYTTVGGAPHLDGSYTIFGEVLEGLDVVDKIAAIEKNQFDRPLKDVKMTIKMIN